jgi:hypothetical protein
MSSPTMIDENGDVVSMFWSCPVKFSPQSVWSFLHCRNFYEKHPYSPFPPIDKVSPRYIRAEYVFENELSRYICEGV